MPPKEPARLAVGLEVEGPPPENAPDSPRAAVSRVLGPPLRAIERADLAQEKVTLGGASSQRRARMSAPVACLKRPEWKIVEALRIIG